MYRDKQIACPRTQCSRAAYLLMLPPLLLGQMLRAAYLLVQSSNYRKLLKSVRFVQGKDCPRKYVLSHNDHIEEKIFFVYLLFSAICLVKIYRLRKALPDTLITKDQLFYMLHKKCGTEFLVGINKWAKGEKTLILYLEKLL